jgi:DNA-binding transcriptional LysR family regulator
MDRFDAMRVFTRIVERRSFTRAADDLDLPRSSVTDAVKGLEARLGVSLLQRSTRHVSPTLDGEAYYRRCVNLISDLEDAEAGFTGVKPSGLVRIDVHGTQARHFLCPAFRAFSTPIRISACTSTRRTRRSTWCAKGSTAYYARASSPWTAR